MIVVWRGRGWWITWIVLFAMVLPMLVLRQIDGPAIDRGVTITMGVAALATTLLGLRFNRGLTFSPSAQEHSLWGVPMQLWAVPMALFALALGSGLITTAEDPRSTRSGGFVTERPAR